MTTVEDLYKAFAVLADAGEDISSQSQSFLSILDGVKGDIPAKKLACQFIPRFFKSFPELAEQAIDAQLDLCEDDDNVIRRQAIKSLPEFAKHNFEHMPRITDILTQLLQQDDPLELKIVRSGLEMLISADVASALSGIFLQIQLGEESVREKAIKFIQESVIKMDIFKTNDEAGTALFSAVKKVLSDVTAEEFTLFISTLSKVKVIVSNPQNIADLITEQAELDKPFDISEPDSINRLITCARQSTPYFTKGASSEKYIEYLLSQVLPVFPALGTVDEGASYQVEVLKLLAELSTYVSEKLSRSNIKDVYDMLLEHLPTKPNTEEEATEEELKKHRQQINFIFVECLIYSFHKFIGKNLEFLTEDETRSKELKLPLQYMARQVQSYIKELKEELNGKSSNVLEESENKSKVVTVRTCTNINTIIKDLFHVPPSVKCQVALSWKSRAPIIPASKESVEDRRKRAGIVPIVVDESQSKVKANLSLEEKRKRAGIIPVTVESSLDKKKKGPINVYTPPGRSGKAGVAMDENFKSNNQRFRGRGRNRGRGGNRAPGQRNESESFLFR